jgi:hypothetical protein
VVEAAPAYAGLQPRNWQQLELVLPPGCDPQALQVGQQSRAVKFGLDWTGLDWSGLEWIGLEWIDLNWIGLEWIGLEWIGLDWSGLDWI